MIETSEQQNLQLVREMFASAARLDAGEIDSFFGPGFEMFSNDVHWDLEEYKRYHLESYKNRKGIQIEIDDLFCKSDRVAGRVRITLLDLDGSKHDVHVIFIIQIKNGLIYRLWETTFPHWQ